MKHLNEYIYEQQQLEIQPINEFLAILGCLAIAAVARLGIKGAKGVADGVDSAWKSVFESQDDNVDTITEAEKKGLEKNDIMFLQIPDKKILKQCILSTDPKEGRDGKGGKGLWTILTKMKENKDLVNINKAPLYPMYAALLTKDKKVAGVFGFSLKFWTGMKKDKDPEKKELAKKYGKYLHIMDIDIDEKYDTKNLLEMCWDKFDEMLKETNSKGMTIFADNEDEIKDYQKKGFTLIEGTKNYMVIDNKNYKEEKKDR